MNTFGLQQRVDQLTATSRQRLLLASGAFVVMCLTSLMMSAASTQSDTWVVVPMAGLAIGAVIQPDSHIALAAIAVAVVQWLVLGEPATSPWSIAVAGAIFLFHALVALMATTPHSATIQVAVFVRWLTRTAVVCAWTVATWVLVVCFDSLDAPGNVVLSACALSALALAVVAFRSLTVPPDR